MTPEELANLRRLMEAFLRALLAAVEAAQSLEARYLGGVRAYVAALEAVQRAAVVREQRDAEAREAFARRAVVATREAIRGAHAAMCIEGLCARCDAAREVWGNPDAIIEVCRSAK